MAVVLSLTEVSRAPAVSCLVRAGGNDRTALPLFIVRPLWGFFFLCVVTLSHRRSRSRTRQ